MDRSIIMISIVFGLFIVCPRMAGMMHVINRNFDIVLWKITILGTLISIPILVLMIYIFSNVGIWATLIFCIGTDFAAAYIIKEISINAAIETVVIAFFVTLGVKLAPFIVNIAAKLIKA